MILSWIKTRTRRG